jgi:hypothetical protein
MASMSVGDPGVMPNGLGSFEQQQQLKVDASSQLVPRDLSQSPPNQQRQVYSQDHSTPEPNVQQQPSPAQTLASPQKQSDQASPESSGDTAAAEEELVCKWKGCRENFERADLLYVS